MRGMKFVAAVALLSSATYPCAAQVTRSFDGSPVLDEPELAAERAMFRTPDGMEISLSVQMDTRLDGQLVLRTVLVQGALPDEKLRIYTETDDAVNKSTMNPQIAEPSERSVSFNFERSRGLQITGVNVEPVPVQVTVNAEALSPADRVAVAPVALDEMGRAQTQFGEIAVENGMYGAVVTLLNENLLVKHVLGSANANVVANTSNNSVIENSTMINLTLPNTSSLALGGSFQMDDLMLPLAQRPNF